MNKRVRAVIADGDHYLFIHRIIGEREYWVLPGGGVEAEDESLAAALMRECEEELGVQVEVGEFLTHTYFEMDGEEQEQHIYHCRITGGELGTGQGPEFQLDSGYVGTYLPEWVHKKDMGEKVILPQEMKDLLADET